ncbi:cytosine permease [Candidatus Protochlamydia phocaeensis]|uniref:cytosine permease n=1 Tax=Candidatus Protochlamydia phocaeensis TaxID=1414722 RepID=UPI0008387430|nr:cytosine permease [Candidatus Protochlamydia phocaeensis]
MKSLQTLQSWRQLLSIQAGGVICLPVIFIGSLLCEKYGWRASFSIIGIGNALLLILGLISARMSVTYRNSTAEQAKRYFGKRGSQLFALALMGSMMGWFAIQLNLMSLGLEHFTLKAGLKCPSYLLNALLGLVLSLLMLKGIKAVNRLADISLPLLILTVGYALWSVEFEPQENNPSFSIWEGLAIILGIELGAVIDLPTFFRHAKSPKDAYISILVLYGLIVPVIEMAGVYLACQGQAKTIVEVLQAGQGVWWSMWTALFILLAGWTTNNANLYSAVASSQIVFPSFTFKARVLMLGIGGTLLACLNPAEHLELSLNLVGLGIGSIGAILLSSYLWESWQGKAVSEKNCLLAWAGGLLGGIGSLLKLWELSSIAFLDAFFLALIVNMMLLNFNKGKVYAAID